MKLQIRQALLRNWTACSRLLVFSMALVFPGFAQERSKPAEVVVPPARERFEKAGQDELIIPGRDLWETCAAIAAHPNPVNCRVIANQDLYKWTTLTLYDSDGDIWWRFNIGRGDPRYSLNKPKKGFAPFVVAGPFEDYPEYVVLRLARESAHWYEVEINERSRETKFILKSDPLWAKINWHLFYNRLGGPIYVDQTRTKLLDAPNGKPIEDLEGSELRIGYEKLDGDWMQVCGWGALKDPFGHYCGWIRWRDGRNILVGSIFTNRKVPDLADK